LDFGEGPEEEEPQGPKLVNKRLSKGWARFVGVTCQTQKQQQKTLSLAPHNSAKTKRKKGYALRTASVFAEWNLRKLVGS
jgi:hypothetical protein